MKFNEATTVPLWWVFVAIPVFTGFCFWLSSVDTKASASVEKTKNIEAVLTEVRDKVLQIDQHQRDLEQFLKGEK